MRIPRTRPMYFRKFVQPFQPPPTHKIDAWGRVVSLETPIPKMPGEAPRPVLAAPAAAAVPPASSFPRTAPPPSAPLASSTPREPQLPGDEAIAQLSPGDRDLLLDLNAKLVRAAPDLPPLLNPRQADRLAAARCSHAESREFQGPDESAPSLPSNSNRGRATKRRDRHENPGKRRRTSRGATAANDGSADHHERHCSICKHPEREEIEAEFLEWFYPGQIACWHNVEKRALYRHAHATGLYARRDCNVRFALAALIEGCHDVVVTADTVVRAVRAYTRINSEGQWIEPPTRITVSPGGAFLSGESLTQAVLPSGPSMRPALESAVELLPDDGDEIGERGSRGGRGRRGK